MAVAEIQAVVHGRTIEIGCYGAGSDWVCRFTNPSQKDLHCDAYSPPPDFGFVWLRESEHIYLASGMVHRDVFRDVDTVDKLLYRIMEEVIRNGSQLAQCIEFIGVEFVATFDGEQGPLQSAIKRRGQVP